MMESDKKSVTCFLFASLVTSYPDVDFGGFVQDLLTDGELEIPAELRDELSSILGNEKNLDDLRSEYIDLFDRGRVANPLYETEYGRDRALVKGNELADIAGFYKAFGLEIGNADSRNEMLDHVAVELEFYSLLLLKAVHLGERHDQAGIEIVDDARRKFLVEHLGRFVSAIADRPGVQESRFYSRVFSWCRDLVALECQRMSVTPSSASWVTDSHIHADLTCGGSAGACLK